MRINSTYKQRFNQYPLYVRTLLSILGGILGILTIGTIIGLARPADAAPVFRLGRVVENEQAATVQGQNDDIRVFSGLGRLRIPLSNSSNMLLTIAFPYPANDTAFTEELAAKIGDVRALAAGYFSSLPEEKLIIIDEETAKQEILRRYNAILRLGRIQSLFFSDMMIIDAI
jgi:flagellar basal body-associated protein FliL